MLFKKVVPVVLVLFLFWMFFSIWTEAVQAAKGGEPGKPGGSIPGAGNIAFIVASPITDTVDVLNIDGEMWSWLPSPDVDHMSWQHQSEYDVPIAISEIAEWHGNGFLDRTGDVWKFDYSTQQWVSIGHP